MIDKKLLALLGANKKYIYYTVALMILGLFANLSITVAICRTIELAVNFQQYETARVFLLPAAIAAAGAAVRYAASRGAGELRDTLGRRAKKELRVRVYGKIVRLGVRSADGMSMAGLTQVGMGIGQGRHEEHVPTVYDLVAFENRGLVMGKQLPDDAVGDKQVQGAVAAGDTDVAYGQRLGGHDYSPFSLRVMCR